VLDDEALQRLRSVPFWEEVFYTERRAGAIVAAFTETVADPVLREALALQGREETRHAKLIRVMIDKYGLDAAERPLEDISKTSKRGSRTSVSANASIRSSVRLVQDRFAVGISSQGNAARFSRH